MAMNNLLRFCDSRISHACAVSKGYSTNSFGIDYIQPLGFQSPLILQGYGFLDLDELSLSIAGLLSVAVVLDNKV
jgi:hypothetical protein